MLREEMKCPECGETERFYIAASVWATTYPDEVAEVEDIEWDKSSYAMCGNCHTTGTVGEFAAVFEQHCLEEWAKGEREWTAYEKGEEVYRHPIERK